MARNWLDYRRLELDGSSIGAILRKYVSDNFPDLDNIEHLDKVRDLYYSAENITSVGAVDAVIHTGDAANELQQLVDAANSRIEANYTATSWSNMQDALSAAQDVLNDVEAIEEDYNQAEDNLQDALDALVKIVSLRDAINAALGLDESDYTPNSWSALDSAVSAGQTVLADADATKTEVSDATSAITTAQGNLVDRADTSALASLITTAQGLDESDYTPNSWSGFPVAISDAIAVRDNANATQTQVDNAKTDLQAAINALVPA